LKRIGQEGNARLQVGYKLDASLAVFWIAFRLTIDQIKSIS